MIIVSVKNYEFKDLYSRYFKRTIDKAVKQIHGAERKLFSNERDIYLKHPNKQLERFPKEKIDNIHRIIVNLGEGVKFYPFSQETKGKNFVSLFDKDAFETIVNELDTIPDFIEYLKKRELLFADKTVTVLPGEENDFPIETATQFFEYEQEQPSRVDKMSILISGTEHDLLGNYLKNERTFPEDIKSKEYNGMFIQLDGNWEDFKSNKQVVLKKKLDKNSYFLDELVKREVLSKSNPDSEELAIAILSFNRFNRRIISNNFLEFFDSYKDTKGLHFARRYADFDGIGVVFAFYTQEMTEEMVKTFLSLAMDSFCVFSKYESKKMILIATTTEFKQFRIGLMKDIEPFPKEMELQILEDVKLLGWFTNHTETNFTDLEYPDVE
ncbi:hypothetical protein ACM55M_10665 [Flavobacterium sp. ZT3R25]|uniref:hypothetical protein n=1 Tax=Flavobacterium galactosi TaxID=3398735 RepID=UPI003A8AEAF4